MLRHRGVVLLGLTIAKSNRFNSLPGRVEPGKRRTTLLPPLGIRRRRRRHCSGDASAARHGDAGGVRGEAAHRRAPPPRPHHEPRPRLRPLPALPLAPHPQLRRGRLGHHLRAARRHRRGWFGRRRDAQCGARVQYRDSVRPEECEGAQVAATSCWGASLALILWYQCFFGGICASNVCSAHCDILLCRIKCLSLCSFADHPPDRRVPFVRH